MGCPSKVKLNENLTFDIETHNPNTAASIDADSAPSYRVYEETGDTPILTGTMDKRDDANTTGCYKKQIACTAVNGFEADKNYMIVISAIVGGITARHSYGFLCENVAADVWSHTPRQLTTTAAQTAAALAGAECIVHRGDDFSWPITGLGDISGYSKLWFSLKEDTADTDANSLIQIDDDTGLLVLNKAAAAEAGNGSIVVDDAVSGDITINLDNAETVNLVPQRNLYYDVQGLTSGGVVRTIIAARGRIDADVTRAIA